MKKRKSKRKISPKAVVTLTVVGILTAIILGMTVIARILWRGVLELAYTVSTMDTVIIIALISGVVTVLGLLVNSIISLRLKNSEFRYKRKTILLKKMEVPYTQFVNMLFDMVQKKEDAGKIDEEVRSQLIRDMSREIILYGSDTVVKKWVEYRRESPKFTVEEHLFYIESILHLIRHDMGIEQGQLSRGDLLALFVNDMEPLSGSHYRLKIGGIEVNMDGPEDEDEDARDIP